MSLEPDQVKCARCGCEINRIGAWLFVFHLVGPAGTGARTTVKEDICSDCALTAGFLYRSWNSLDSCFRELERCRRQLVPGPSL